MNNNNNRSDWKKYQGNPYFNANEQNSLKRTLSDATLDDMATIKRFKTLLQQVGSESVELFEILDRREKSEDRYKEEILRLQDELDRTKRELANKNSIIAIRNQELQELKVEYEAKLADRSEELNKSEKEKESLLQLNEFLKNQISNAKNKISVDKVLDFTLDGFYNIYNLCMGNMPDVVNGTEADLQAYCEKVSKYNRNCKRNAKLFYEQLKFDLEKIGINLVFYSALDELPTFDDKEAMDHVEVVATVPTDREEFSDRVARCTKLGYYMPSDPAISRKCIVSAYLYNAPETNEGEEDVSDETEDGTQSGTATVGTYTATASGSENDSNSGNGETNDASTTAESQSIYNSPVDGETGVDAEVSVNNGYAADGEQGENVEAEPDTAEAAPESADGMEVTEPLFGRQPEAADGDEEGRIQSDETVTEADDDGALGMTSDIEAEYVIEEDSEFAEENGSYTVDRGTEG